MNWDERAEILQSCKYINQVLPFDDSDETANDIIKQVCSLYRDFDVNIYFANGGDRTTDNVPELAVCKELGVTMLWGVGGGKIQSSSWLIENKKKVETNEFGDDNWATPEMGETK